MLFLICLRVLSNGVRNHIRAERKEDRREEVKQKTRLEERRRILQTELPEIYKQSYDNDLFMFYSSTPTNYLPSPHRSSTASMNSFTGSQVPMFPPIDTAQASSAENLDISRVSSGRYFDDVIQEEEKSSISLLKRHSKPTVSFAKDDHIKKSYKLMRMINAYLERKKSISSIDPVMLPNTNSKN